MRRVQATATPFQEKVADSLIDLRLAHAEPEDLRTGFGMVLEATQDLWDGILDKADRKTLLDQAIRAGALLQRLVEDNLMGE